VALILLVLTRTTTHYGQHYNLKSPKETQFNNTLNSILKIPFKLYFGPETTTYYDYLLIAFFAHIEIPAFGLSNCVNCRLPHFIV
jgi:hypothetical protein